MSTSIFNLPPHWTDPMIGKVLAPDTFIDFLHNAFKAGASKHEIYRLAKWKHLSKHIRNWEEQVFVIVKVTT